jgi:hypothetical protein
MALNVLYTTLLLFQQRSNWHSLFTFFILLYLVLLLLFLVQINRTIISKLPKRQQNSNNNPLVANVLYRHFECFLCSASELKMYREQFLKDYFHNQLRRRISKTIRQFFNQSIQLSRIRFDFQQVDRPVKRLGTCIFALAKHGQKNCEL